MRHFQAWTYQNLTFYAQNLKKPYIKSDTVRYLINLTKSDIGMSIRDDQIKALRMLTFVDINC